jgi:AcrR family transcriptional regulator
MKLESTFLSPGQDAVRNAILEAARDLFARFGYKKTTMEDIAQILRKGKSSLYYYFENKEEIFQAVIELESAMLETKLMEVVKANKFAKEKLHDYVVVRMETLRGLMNYQKAIREGMNGGYDFLNEVKNNADKNEEEMLKAIMDEGVVKDEFELKNTRLAAVGFGTALRGLEMPLFLGVDNFDDFRLQLDNILNIMFYGILKRNK